MFLGGRAKSLCYISVMDQLLQSRLQGASAIKLQGLSPDRFGRGAFANLSYTPSKLAGNVLFKQAASMRRVEESSSRAREWEAVGQLLRDKLRHLQEEKEGVEQALSQQIAMYKRILGESESAHERSLMALQTAFSDEMQRVIGVKEEEAKFVQCEKELLENRILELEDAISGMRGELDSQVSGREEAEGRAAQAKQQMEVMVREKERLEAQMRRDAEDRQKEREGSSSARQQMQLQFARREEQMLAEHTALLQEAKSDKQRAIDSLTAAHREQLLLYEQQRIGEGRLHEEGARKLRAEWQSEAKRLEQSLQNQKAQILLLNKTLQQQKAQAGESLRKMACDAATLTLRNQQLQQEAQTISRQLTEVREEAKRYQNTSTQTSANLQATVQKLRREVEMGRKQAQAQVYEREKHRLQGQQMRREIMVLRKSVQRTSLLLEENSVLSRELKGLKDLLVESSLQMQRCKGEFLRLDKQKEILMGKLRELDMENEALYRVRLQMEEEARVWRETYYLNRR